VFENAKVELNSSMYKGKKGKKGQKARGQAMAEGD
jgi:hypothetical protein